jgi:hypothetical protein
MTVFSRLLRRPERPDPRAAITRLFRNPPQLRVIARHFSERKSLRALVHAMADGAEAVSLLIALDPAHRTVDLKIEGRDLHQVYVDDAGTFTYTPQHFPRGIDPRSFGDYLARRPFGGWRVRSRWRPLFHYVQGDLLNPAPDLAREGFDLALCQNVLISLPEEARASAFDHLVSFLRPGGMLALGGGPLGTIHRLACERGLEPVLDEVEAIHESWEVQRAFWNNARRPYWALEPFDAGHPEGPERYCTLFVRPEAG